MNAATVAAALREAHTYANSPVRDRTEHTANVRRCLRDVANHLEGAMLEIGDANRAIRAAHRQGREEVQNEIRLALGMESL